MMNGRLQFKSVRTRLTAWVLLMALVPLVGAYVVIPRQDEARLLREAADHLAALRDLRTAQLEQRLTERVNDLELLATAARIQAPFEEATGEGSRTRLEAARKHLRHFCEVFPDLQQLDVVDVTSGVVRASSNPAAVDRDASQSSSFTQPRDTGQTFLQDTNYASRLDGPSMAIATPIRGPNGDAPSSMLGILVGHLNLTNFCDRVLLDRTELGESGETLLVNREGYALSELRGQRDAPLKVRPNSELTRRAAAGESGVLEARDYRQVAVVAAYGPVSRLGWGLVTKMDLAEVQAPVRAMQRHLATAFAGVLGALLLALPAMIRSVSRPLRTLRDAADAMAAGNLDIRAAISRPDEIGALAESFNSTAETLRDQFASAAALGRINASMVRHATPDEFLEALTQRLMEVTESCLVAAYRLNPTEHEFAPITSIGTSADALPPFREDIREGEFGQALTTQRIVHLKELSAAGRFLFKTVAGTAVPRELITIPLLVDGRVEAVIALAALKEYPRGVAQTLERAHPPMNMGLADRLQNEKARSLSKRLQDRNQELEAQSRELGVQAEELKRQADELTEQNVELDLERRRVEEANRHKSEFLAHMSHELRTPLNSVLALSEVLQSRAAERLEAEERSYLRIIERNGHDLLRMINDLLDLARIEAGRVELHPRPLALRATLHDLLERVNPLAKQKGLELKLDLPADLPRITMDETRLQHILQNLLSNAIKFTEQGGITVTAATAGQEIRIQVADTGPGIPEDQRAAIFEAFQQGDSGPARKHGGAGLGLAIARQNARLLGGDLTVTSRPGEGAVFTVTLPLVSPVPPAEEDVTAPRTEAPPHATPSGKAPRVLLVEDNEATIIQVRHVLNRAGYRVTVARGGAEALERVREAVPDGLILDLMMPGMDGLETLIRLRELPGAANVPVLALTAKTLTAQDLEVLRRNQVKQLIQKGDVDLAALLAAIRELVGGPSADTRDNEAAPEPTSRPAPRRRPGSQPPVPNRPANRPLTVLAIEDNADNRATLKAMLADRFALLEAPDGETGLERLEADLPDLVLLDISLPGIDGCEVARCIRAHPTLSAVPVIALTAYALPKDQERIREAGCDDCLTKPIERKELLELLETWLHPADENT